MLCIINQYLPNMLNLMCDFLHTMKYDSWQPNLWMNINPTLYQIKIVTSFVILVALEQNT